MVTIKDALQRMMKDGEFDKIIKNAKGREKTNAKEFYNAIKDFDEKDYEKVPTIVFVKACKSWNVWADIYCYMEMMENEIKNAQKA